MEGPASVLWLLSTVNFCSWLEQVELKFGRFKANSFSNPHSFVGASSINFAAMPRLYSDKDVETAKKVRTKNVALGVSSLLPSRHADNARSKVERELNGENQKTSARTDHHAFSPSWAVGSLGTVQTVMEPGDIMFHLQLVCYVICQIFIQHVRCSHHLETLSREIRTWPPATVWPPSL